MVHVMHATTYSKIPLRRARNLLFYKKQNVHPKSKIATRPQKQKPKISEGKLLIQIIQQQKCLNSYG